MLNRLRLLFFVAGSFILPAFIPAQSLLPEVMTFTRAARTETLSQQQYRQRLLGKSDFEQRKENNSLPSTYILTHDTLRNTGASRISYNENGKSTAMLAVSRGKNVFLFSVMNTTLQNSPDIQLSDFKDLTGDKKNEIFIYITEGSSRRLEVWDAVKAIKLLDLEVSNSAINGRRTREGTPIGYTRDLKFYDKLFTSFDNRFLGSCNEQTCPQTVLRFTQAYAYTPKAYVLKLECCGLNIAAAKTKSGLKAEYQRLKKLNIKAGNCCQANYSGLMFAISMLADSVNLRHSKEQVLELFGPADKTLGEVPAELQPPGRELPKGNNEVLIYQWRGTRDYFYLIFRDKKMIRKDWYFTLE